MKEYQLGYRLSYIVEFGNSKIQFSKILVVTAKPQPFAILLQF